ncbi:MAG TPA: Gfo/Idh/MocA family oxidoreductase [Gemmataceae bacterium]|jgi:predicted dehydrogenase|nr:Gfo/Idh/MocA family oxidoreductase [Gemmataceae bacterium]
MKLEGKITRRRALQIAAGATVPMFIPTRLLGDDAPSKKITMGFIGVGWMGGDNLSAFLGQRDCRVVAIADVDQRHLHPAVDKVNNHYKNKDCKGYKDFRELLARNDIDAVCISTPDHWHSIPAVEAARAKKDIYCEKPLSHTFAEGVAMVEAVTKNDRIWQTGSWQRSVPNFRQGVELVLNGYIGKVKRVEVGLPAGHSNLSGAGPKSPNTEPPKEVDYDFWVGPAEYLPFNLGHFHKDWRWNYAYGGGQLLDWIGHHNDIAHWGLSNPKFGCGPDSEIGPLEVSGTASFPPKDAVWNTATKYRVECKYPNDIELVIAGGYSEIKSGTKWIGDNGWVWVDRGGFKASDEHWIKEIQEREKKKDLAILLPVSPGHQRQFLDCVKSRQKTLTPVEIAHRSQTPGHLGYIASVVGRKLKWDAAHQQIVDDPEASKLLSREMRAPWHL